ncbi:hypothetical protein CspeluHIS016_0406520 [Cutaneotrichosporon spelunceum]|uniref:Uncharacterized protein n=1 Tax=Cutaneotrichosporon spelunceum TaxID=1672016 RepID=A0AAD3YD52_9TREE|nr:hypothetical protein CspeluHIS016_0406520 [Cutaneotrichosporon spelunceum]
MPPAKCQRKAVEVAQPTRAPTRSSARLRDKAAKASCFTQAPLTTSDREPTSSNTFATEPMKIIATRKAATNSLIKPQFKQAEEAVDNVASILPAKPVALWVNEDCLYEISSYLGSGDLAKLLTVNSAFYTAAAPHLYRVLKQRAGCECRGLYDRNTELVSRYTTAVEFFPHSHHTHHPRLETGHITTHIVNFDVNDKSTGVDIHGRSAAWGTYKCPRCPKAPAPPKRLVLRPVYTTANFSKKGERKSKLVVIPLGTKCVNKIVHISLNMGKATFTSQARYGFSPRPINPFKKMTFVIFPAFWNCGPVILEQSGLNHLRSLRNSILSHVTKLYDHTIHIVGLEVRDPFAPEWEWNQRELRESNAILHFEDDLEQYIRQWFTHPDWTAAEKDRFRNRITYQTLRDYLENGDWGEELNWALVGRWLNALDARENGRMTTPVLPGIRRGKKVPRKALAKRKRKYESETETESEVEITTDEDEYEGGVGDSGVKVEAMESDEEDY